MRRVRRIPPAPGLQLEAVLLLGGLRALLLQLTHPAIGRGVAEHSDFAADPAARLHGTLVYVYVIAAGDERTAAAVTNRIDRLHARVVSAPGAPVPYDAADPDLQFWVTATIADTGLRIADAAWGRLPGPLADEVLAQFGRIGTALGLPADRWPATRADFDRAFAEALPALRLDEPNRRVIAELFAARATPLWVRAALPFLIAATLPTLPTTPELRRELAALAPVRRPDLLPLARRLAPLYRMLPVRVRRLPATRLIAAARRRVRGGGAPGRVAAET